MRVARQLAAAPSTEAEYSAALEHECEFCGKAFERESSMHQHQTGHFPTDGKPWSPLAHREQTEEAFEVELILDVRGVPERGRRFYLVKWRGFDGDPMEESTWETAEDLAETAAGAVDDFSTCGRRTRSWTGAGRGRCRGSTAARGAASRSRRYGGSRRPRRRLGCCRRGRCCTARGRSSTRRRG
jgi:hypothetical protein